MGGLGEHCKLAYYVEKKTVFDSFVYGTPYLSFFFNWWIYPVEVPSLLSSAVYLTTINYTELFRYF